jgi:fatty-acyl-CoA synthase
MCYANIDPHSMSRHSVYLWTLPMFHCNGWCFPWTITAAGRHARLPALGARRCHLRGDGRAQGDASVRRAGRHVLTDQCHGRTKCGRCRIASQFNTAAAPPPEAVLSRMEQAGFDVTHVYGLTETYGPRVRQRVELERMGCARSRARAQKKARQGVRYAALDGLTVMNPETMEVVPSDGETLGEVMFRGNIVMKGYLKNPQATDEAFAGGWFHSGDLGVLHPDGYIQLKDRSKDIIISGGENISSIEVEDALYKHPSIAACGVVAKPDDKWGETPCAFIELKPGKTATEAEIVEHCRTLLARFKCRAP